jgi:hypothetical protein
MDLGAVLHDFNFLSLLFFRMYMLFGILVVVATDPFEFSSLISHFRESNLGGYP